MMTVKSNPGVDTDPIEIIVDFWKNYDNNKTASTGMLGSRTIKR